MKKAISKTTRGKAAVPSTIVVEMLKVSSETAIDPCYRTWKFHC